ncbi:MAG: efflux RND transporter permease subunit [Calditrichaeota bacterium]|nr:efflux RND transporter permease subunit [Calditrichota bacterium]MCB0304732.1 efflux RND transporter permease subunit [Calditrichota bacterium]MCB9089392.1 efflux RND transporter permease subunit [Calditrichia bacterium]
MNRLIAWFAENQVAANLLMIVIIAAGIISVASIKYEVFPEMSSDIITVSVVYRGGAPEEVEEGVCVRIEEAIQDLEGIKKLSSTAAEGLGSVTVEVKAGYDARKLLDDVKARVDGISTFPDETEQPVVQELLIRRQVINVAISGPADEKTLKTLGESVRDELSDLPAISQVELSAARPYEISIEVSEQALRRYGLTFDEIVRAVRFSSLDLPGGAIETRDGEILLRTKGQAYRGSEFENLILRSSRDGVRLKLGDVATVIDGFADTDQAARFNNQPAVLVQVFRVGDESALEVAAAVKEYVADAQPRMPAGIELTTWRDDSRILKDRLSLLLRNGRSGLLLVFLALALFLRLKLALWVGVGMAISFFGAFAVMPQYDVSINLLSLFAFILVLGIVVDDAIVVGENIYTHMESRQKTGLRAAIEGAQEVGVPVVFAVLTTVAAFFPLLMVPGNIGKFMKVVPIIVIATLLFSLLESLLILPAHLSHLRMDNQDDSRQGIRQRWRRFQDRFAAGLKRFADTRYRNSLRRALNWRYPVLALALGGLIITLSLVAGGRVKFTFMPDVEADNVVALVKMPPGTPAEVTAEVVHRLEESARQLKAEYNGDGHGSIQHMLSSIGEQPFLADRGGPNRGRNGSFSGANLGEVNLQLYPSEERSVTSPELARRWRELTGPIPDVDELTFTSSLFSSGEAVNIQLSGSNYEMLRAATETLKAHVAQYPGVFDVGDSYQDGKQEMKLRIKPEAEALGLTLADLARQVRQAFYGEEAQRIQRGRDDVRVMVRYPEEERRSVGDLENLRVRMPGGTEVPFAVAAEVEEGRGFASINRTDRKRTISVTADVDMSIANSNEIVADITRNYIPQLQKQYPGIGYSLEGEQAEQQETLGGLLRGFLFAQLLIYVLLAIPFRSYLQPLIVMSAIPFGFIGAIWGHVLMGSNLTILSGFGIVALTGVVVNDSLVMVDFINRARAEGLSLMQAVREAGVSRFRPIILTSLTTFAGLTPLLLERSLQAQFLIPMAISLAFGVLFATLITLILVPVLYTILEDVKIAIANLLNREQPGGDIIEAEQAG